MAIMVDSWGTPLYRNIRLRVQKYSKWQIREMLVPQKLSVIQYLKSYPIDNPAWVMHRHETGQGGVACMGWHSLTIWVLVLVCTGGAALVLRANPCLTRFGLHQTRIIPTGPKSNPQSEALKRLMRGWCRGPGWPARPHIIHTKPAPVPGGLGDWVLPEKFYYLENLPFPIGFQVGVFKVSYIRIHYLPPPPPSIDLCVSRSRWQ